MASNGRTAWITGGGRGIGKATALTLAEDGFDVAVSARSEDELESTAKACRDHGVQALAAPLDVTEPGTIKSAYDRIDEELSAPSVLVNNAGVAQGIPFLKTTGENMEFFWRVNLLGAFHCTQAALPSMLEDSWGRIVNVASVAGKVGASYTTAYAVSKHGMLGLTRSIAQEFATKGITSNAVCPGYVDTPMTDGNVEQIAETTDLSQEEARERLESMSPQKRLITPEEVAAQVAYLCQEEARGVNGQALTIDGGQVQW